MQTHVITGAGSGIGRATARMLSDRGDDLILLARSTRRGAALEESFPGARVVVADLARPEAVSEVFGVGDGPDRLDHGAGTRGVRA